MIGCATSSHQKSSVVQYLYPNEDSKIESPSIPTLSLPLRVGIAFVPGSSIEVRRSVHAQHSGHIGNYGPESFTEKDKMMLMKEVAAHFKQYDFVKSIELIPSAYLKPNGSFTNLDQIKTMYGIDVIVLLSYDQTQFTDEDFSSISYWTVIGMYAVKGEKNDTHTMLDAVVYDIKSRKMLFRAPGLSHIKSKATPVNLSEQSRLDRMEGFNEASKDLIVNLDEQLNLFKEKIKESPESIKVIRQSGYTGTGSLDIYFVLLSLMIALRLYVKRNTTMP
nr:rhombotarget lipoprotein [Nitrospina sp. Nb-3]